MPTQRSSFVSASPSRRRLRRTLAAGSAALALALALALTGSSGADIVEPTKSSQAPSEAPDRGETPTAPPSEDEIPDQDENGRIIVRGGRV